MNYLLTKVGALVIGFVAILFVPFALAQTGDSAINGWAWSENIGWVSLSGVTYGLTQRSDGRITGYAWSEHIGWISANPGHTYTCGSPARINGENLSGWMRALAGRTSQSGGWDGCIALRGSNWGVTTDSNPTYDPRVSGAWGSAVIGWLAFNLQASEPVPPLEPDLIEPPPPPVEVTISAEPTRVRKGNSTTITWSSQNADTCTVSGPGGPWTDLSGTQPTPPLELPTLYTIECFNTGGSKNATFTVALIPSFQEI